MKKNNVIIGLLLITFITAIYSKIYDKPLDKDNLIRIKVILIKKPIIEDTGGNKHHPYIDLKLKKYKKDFRLIYCGLKASKKQKILNLSPGDKLSILVKKEDVHKKEEGIDKYVDVLEPEVFQITNLENGEQLLTLSDFNDCHVNSWKIFLIPIVILTAILIYRLLKEKKRQEGRE